MTEERNIPYAILPSELVNVCICKNYAEGNRRITVKEIAGKVPLLGQATTEEGKELFNYLGDYRQMPSGHYSGDVSENLCIRDDLGDLFRSDQDIFIITGKGIPTFRAEVTKFYENNRAAATALGIVLETTLEQLLPTN